MAWLSVNEDGQEQIHLVKPNKLEGAYWTFHGMNLPKGTIKKILGYELSWADETVEIKE